MAVRLKTANDIEKLRRSGAVLARVLEELKKEARPGILLSVLDQKAREFLKLEGATPAFLGYIPEGMATPYPAAICTSVNETIVHGLPGKYMLQDGDLLKIDIGVMLDGYVADGAVTVAIGRVSETARKLMRATEESIAHAIRACKAGGHVGDIGDAISRHITKAGFSVIKGLTGHGVGFALHEDPPVPNFGERGKGMELAEGLVIAIEPMVSAGSPFVAEEEDESFRTKDRSISAHFEHTVAITAHGAEILTKI